MMKLREMGSAKGSSLMAVVLALLMALVLAACAGNSNPKPAQSADILAANDGVAVNVVALNGPTGIGMAQLSERSDVYNVRFAGAPDEIVSSLTNGSADIAALPTNLASVLYNKTQGGVTLIAVDTYGSLYLLQNGGEEVTSFDQLKGKKVYATGQGANPQYILEYLLGQAGLQVGTDVEVEYLPEHAELAALLAKGEAELGMLPEPFVSVAQAQNENIKVAVDMGEQWKKASGSDLAMGCVVVRTAFLQEHPEAVKYFLDELALSVKAANDDTATVAKLCVDKGILPNEAVANSAIPQCSLVCVTGAEMKKPVETFLGVLAEANPAAVGGALPSEDFYYSGQ